MYKEEGSMKKQRVNVLLDSEELEKFKQNVIEPQFSSLSREINIFMKKENEKFQKNMQDTIGEITEQHMLTRLLIAISAGVEG